MDGTTKELFIPKVILLTIGNSGMVAGRISFSIMASSSFLTSAKLSFQARNPQDLPSVCCQWVQVPELGICLDGALAFASHSTLQLSPEVVHYQLGIFHFSKEYRIAHLCPEHLLPTPVERRPIKYADKTQVRYRVTIRCHQGIWKCVRHCWTVNAGYHLLLTQDYPHRVRPHCQAQVRQQVPPFIFFHSSLDFRFFSSPVMCRFCIMRYCTNSVFNPAAHL